MEGKGIRVVHFDDDPDQLFFTKRILEEIDPSISVESHNSPRDVAVIDFGLFDCVVSDLQMPEMNGVELSRQVRARSDIPIIVYSGRDRGEVEEAARGVGIDGIVAKGDGARQYERLGSQVREAVERRLAGLLKALS